MTGPEEEHRRAELHRIEQWTRKQPVEPGQPPPDPVHVVRIRLPERDADLYALCRWSTARRLVRDAAETGDGDQIADLGPDAMRVAQAFDAATLDGGTLIVHIGLARDGRWLTWKLPVPREPVPGSPEWNAGRN